ADPPRHLPALALVDQPQLARRDVPHVAPLERPRLCQVEALVGAVALLLAQLCVRLAHRERARALAAEDRLLALAARLREPLLGRSLRLLLRRLPDRRARVGLPDVLQARLLGKALAQRHLLRALAARAGDADLAVGGGALRGVLQLERRELEVLAEAVVPRRV